jgi:hypothetical protein
LVIDHLRRSLRDDEGRLAYFYFDYHEHAQQTPVNFVCSILKQLLSHIDEIPTAVPELHRSFERDEGRPQLEDLVAVLLRVCNYFPRVYIVADALDECEAQTHRGPVLEILQKLAMSKARLFTASRPAEDIKRALGTLSQIVIEAREEDIQKFLTDKIENNADIGDIVDEAMKEEIVATIARSSQGMWVFRPLPPSFDR